MSVVFFPRFLASAAVVINEAGVLFLSWLHFKRNTFVVNARNDEYNENNNRNINNNNVFGYSTTILFTDNFV